MRWLRPEFQKPSAGIAATFEEEFAPRAPVSSTKLEKQPWPKTIPEQASAVRLALASERGIVTPQQLARNFTRARVERIDELLQTLVSDRRAKSARDATLLNLRF